MEYRAGIEALIMLYLMALGGLWLRKIGILGNQSIAVLSGIIVNLAWPAMIIASLQPTMGEVAIQDFISVAALSTIVLSMGALIIYRIARFVWGKTCAPAMALLCAIPNAGYVGMPVIEAVFGTEGTLYLCAFLAGFNLVVWTVGVRLYGGCINRPNVGMAALTIGLILFFTRVRLPAAIFKATKSLGDMTTPLCMLILGARLLDLRFSALRDVRLWVAMIVKLVGMPLLSLSILRLLGLSVGSDVFGGVVVLAMGMPSAMAAQVFSEKYGCEPVLAAEGIAVTLLASLATMPGLMWILR